MLLLTEVLLSSVSNRSKDVSRQIVTDRLNVNDDGLARHYDMRDESVTTEQQRRYLDRI